MKKLLAVYINDLKLSINGLYFYIEVIMAVTFIIAMLVAIPDTFETSREYYLFLNLDQQNISHSLFEDFQDAIITNSREELELKLNENRNAVGIEITERSNNITLDIVLQGHESQSLRNFILAEIEASIIADSFGFIDIVDEVRLQDQPDSLSDRENILPIYLTINIALMGLFIIAAYIFLDKEEGIVKAYAVSPLGIWSYLASKAFVILTMGIVTSLVVVFSIMQFRVNYLLLTFLVLCFNVFGSALGILITSFYDSMIKAMEALYLVIMVMMIGSITYFVPAFNPIWIRVLPVYPMLFSFRELLLEQGNILYALQNAIIFLVLGSFIFIYASKRFSKSLSV